MIGLLPLSTAALAQNTSTEVDTLIEKGLALSYLGNYKQAIQYFNTALAVQPNNTYALTGKGLALESLGNHTGAIQYYDKVLAIQPNIIDVIITHNIIRSCI